MKDGSVIRHMTLQELNLGDLDHVLHVEVLVQGPDPRPVPPGPGLVRPLAVGLRCVHAIVVCRPEAEEDTKLFSNRIHVSAGDHSLNDTICSLIQSSSALSRLT